MTIEIGATYDSRLFLNSIKVIEKQATGMLKLRLTTGIGKGSCCYETPAELTVRLANGVYYKRTGKRPDINRAYRPATLDGYTAGDIWDNPEAYSVRIISIEERLTPCPAKGKMNIGKEVFVTMQYTNNREYGKSAFGIAESKLAGFLKGYTKRPK